MQIPEIQSKPWDVNTRLADFGLTTAELHRVLEASHLARVSCTENDAQFIPGTDAWSRALRRLREILIPMGWKRLNLGNYSLTVSELYGVNLIVATGDDSTGLELPFNPSTNSTKGLLTEIAVNLNAENQGSLFGGFNEHKIRKYQRLLQHPTWVFLIYITDELARGELSLPDTHSTGKQLNDWKERILIPEISFDPGTVKSADDYMGPEAEVKISRKA